jgi:hypothetical protein
LNKNVKNWEHLPIQGTQIIGLMEANEGGNQFGFAKKAHSNIIPKCAGMVEFGGGNP